jgi:hypothetical protein
MISMIKTLICTWVIKILSNLFIILLIFGIALLIYGLWDLPNDK